MLPGKKSRSHSARVHLYLTTGKCLKTAGLTHRRNSALIHVSTPLVVASDVPRRIEQRKPPSQKATGPPHPRQWNLAVGKVTHDIVTP